jgi:flagellar basal-body rod protein FlgG
MIRALYTAATGMQAQQLNIDVIAHNLANVNTTGYKKSRAEFADLLYQSIKAPGSSTSNNTQSPTGIQVGLGARPAAVTRLNTQGDFVQTGNDLDVSIEGLGYLQITLPDGATAFTRAGALKRDATGNVVNSDGLAVTPGINIPAGTTNVTIGQDGVVTGLQNGAALTTLGNLQTASFANPAGLRPLGKNLFQETETSGAAQLGTPGENNSGTLLQGFLENSNVSVVEELVGLITGQRAYEVTSKAIQTADEMLRVTNAIVS